MFSTQLLCKILATGVVVFRLYVYVLYATLAGRLHVIGRRRQRSFLIYSPLVLQFLILVKNMTRQRNFLY